MHTFKWIWTFICFKAVSQILWASLLCLLGHILPDPLEWGHVLANEVRERMPFQAGYSLPTQSTRHWWWSPHLYFLTQFYLSKGLQPLLFQKLLRFLLWWPSPLTNTSYNSLYHCGLRSDRRQMLAFNLLSWT